MYYLTKEINKNSFVSRKNSGEFVDDVASDVTLGLAVVVALECLAEIPLLIFAHDLLAEDGIFVFEHGKGNGFSDMPQFIERRTYGSVKFSLFRIKPSS